ncbi:MAG TPA: hypothetical protein DDZ51_28570 [Planctomycetaceae bacterium]|nr:hypothetical protein [Planctomycetaceae bacterium]
MLSKEGCRKTGRGSLAPHVSTTRASTDGISNRSNKAAKNLQKILSGRQSTGLLNERALARGKQAYLKTLLETLPFEQRRGQTETDRRN